MGRTGRGEPQAWSGENACACSFLAGALGIGAAGTPQTPSLITPARVHTCFTLFRVRTDVVDGFLLDRGFQIFLTGYPEVQVGGPGDGGQEV